MGKILENLFRRAGRTYGTARWILKSLAGSEEESLQAEYVLGAYLAKEIKKKFPLDQSPATNELLQTIGASLSDRLTDKRRTFHFYILGSPEINAFALPGGFIFTTTVLLDFCQKNEAEVAFILGHEMGHVIKGHALERMVANSLIGIISSIGPGGGVVGSLTKKTLARLLSTSYSRDQELEADWFGIRIMDAAGYNPHTALLLIDRMKNRKQDDQVFRLEKYFSSHPEFELRLQNLKRFWEE